MPGIYDKIKAAGLAGVVVSAGAWLVSATTNWLRLKGIPEDVTLAIGVFVGGLVATVAGYLKTEHTGTPTASDRLNR